jgi:hypothetical protein
MNATHRVQIHQCNDPEILGFFNQHRVRYRLIGDHLFIVRGRDADLAAGPGDWLLMTPDGTVEVEPGEDMRRAQQSLAAARAQRRELQLAG